MATDIKKPFKDLEFVPENQQKRLIEWNDSTSGDFPSDKRLHHLFEQAAENTPDKTAIISGNKQVKFKELNGQANQLARYLVTSLGIKTEEFIGLFLDKNELMMITVLGVWKSGTS